MREILFKAKRTDNGEWVEGFPFRSILSKELDRMTVYEKLEFATVVNTYEIDPQTVCQYTGLTDKNEVNAFECDKVYDPHEKRTFTIKWDRELAAFVLEDDEGWFYSDIARLSYCEIIGNIHDNT